MQHRARSELTESVSERVCTERSAILNWICSSERNLFSGTIGSNIGFKEITQEGQKFRKLLPLHRQKNLLQKRKIPYDDPIAQGGNNVSGGQNSATGDYSTGVKKPKILIFDDSLFGTGL